MTIRVVEIIDAHGKPMGPVKVQTIQRLEAIQNPKSRYNLCARKIPVIINNEDVKSLNPSSVFPKTSKPNPWKIDAKGPYWAKYSELGRYPSIYAIAPVSMIPS
jgi:hypothetical protein